MQVDKRQFDALLGKLLKAEPLPKSAIPAKKEDRPKTQKRTAKTRKP